MYTNHFGLKMLPFENVPDPNFFFDEGDHARVLKRITDSLNAGRGLTVITGTIGSGKTTLSQKMISDFSNDIRLIWIALPPGNSMELFLLIAQEIGLKPSTSEMAFVLRDIRDALLKIHSEGSKCLVIIDESHLLSDEIINGIRLLNNLEEGATKLIQILMLGQEEIMETIDRPEMEAFKQRIATLEIIGKMNADRIRKYISHRIEVAGGSTSIFTDTGWEALVKAFGSGSTPRVINSLSDRSLNVAFEREKTKVDIDDVFEASRGMGLTKEVFHYQLELEQSKRKKQVSSKKGNDSKKKSKALSRESDGSDQSTQPGCETAPSISKKDHKDLQIPILFLLLSIVVLWLSIFSYCQTSGSPEPMTCLQELINVR